VCFFTYLYLMGHTVHLTLVRTMTCDTIMAASGTPWLQCRSDMLEDTSHVKSDCMGTFLSQFLWCYIISFVDVSTTKTIIKQKYIDQAIESVHLHFRWLLLTMKSSVIYCLILMNEKAIMEIKLCPACSFYNARNCTKWPLWCIVMTEMETESNLNEFLWTFRLFT